MQALLCCAMLGRAVESCVAVLCCAVPGRTVEGCIMYTFSCLDSLHEAKCSMTHVLPDCRLQCMQLC